MVPVIVFGTSSFYTGTYVHDHTLLTQQVRVFKKRILEVLQSPVQSFRGENLDFPLCTIPTVSLYEKYGVFDCSRHALIKNVFRLLTFNGYQSTHT